MSSLVFRNSNCTKPRKKNRPKNSPRIRLIGIVESTKRNCLAPYSENPCAWIPVLIIISKAAKTGEPNPARKPRTAKYQSCLPSPTLSANEITTHTLAQIAKIIGPTTSTSSKGSQRRKLANQRNPANLCSLLVRALNSVSAFTMKPLHRFIV